MQEMKKQLVGIDEIKKDRDARIDRLRIELEQTCMKYDEAHRTLLEMEINYTQLKEDHGRLKQDHDDVCEKLRLANSERIQKEEAMNVKGKHIDQMEEQIKIKDKSLEKLKKEVDKLQKRLTEVER